MKFLNVGFFDGKYFFIRKIEIKIKKCVQNIKINFGTYIWKFEDFPRLKFLMFFNNFIIIKMFLRRLYKYNAFK